MIKVLKHSFDFLLLAAILSFGLFGLFYYRHRVPTQMVISVLLGITYVFWGILHHFHKKDLHCRVVLEYIAISALVVFVLIIFLLRV